jgi:hydrogenase nickel incorporation protein HypB
MEQPILAKSGTLAGANRARFEQAGVFALNVLASPGSGKTSTILALIEALRDEFNIAVIEGDVASKVDSEKIREQGIAAVQVDTDGACRLDSGMVSRALGALDLSNLDLILLENVGSLTCPADLDLGENAKVVVLAVPEGDDMPLRHPGVFRASQAIVLNKVDTMPLLDFDEQAFRSAVQQLNPAAPIFPLSATTGQGVEEFAAWLASRIHAVGK